MKPDNVRTKGLENGLQKGIHAIQKVVEWCVRNRVDELLNASRFVKKCFEYNFCSLIEDFLIYFLIWNVF